MVDNRKGANFLHWTIWGPRYMKFWLWVYFLVLSSMQKPAFQNFDFYGGSPYGPVLNIRWISDKTLFAFSKATKSPRFMKFWLRLNLVQLKTCRSPIFEILI